MRIIFGHLFSVYFADPVSILVFHQFLKSLKNVNTWLSWLRHQMMTKLTFVNIFIKTYSILSIQYMYKISRKMDKHFLRYNMFFHPVATSSPPPSLALRFWDFQKSQADVGLRYHSHKKFHMCLQDVKHVSYNLHCL